MRPSFYFYSSRDCKRARSTSDNRNENLTLAPRVLLAAGENYEDDRNENLTLLFAGKANYVILRIIIFFIDITNATASRQTDLNLDKKNQISSYSCVINFLV